MSSFQLLGALVCLAFGCAGHTDEQVDSQSSAAFDGDSTRDTTDDGSCPTYELDRVFNPTNSRLGKCCVTVSHMNGALVPLPRAVGYLGCKAGVIPTR